MPLYFFYTMVQKKSKMTKNSNQGGGGGPALTVKRQTLLLNFLIPLFLFRVGLASPPLPPLAWALRPPPPLSLSLSLSLARACGPCVPLFTWALFPHPCFAQLVPYHFLLAALSLMTPPPPPPRMPKKPLVSAWLEFHYPFVWWKLMNVLPLVKPHKVWGETFGDQKRHRLVCWDCMKNDDPARIPKGLKLMNFFCFFFFYINKEFWPKCTVCFHLQQMMPSFKIFHHTSTTFVYLQDVWRGYSSGFIS